MHEWGRFGLANGLGPYRIFCSGVRDFDSAATVEDIFYCYRILLGRNPSTIECPGALEKSPLDQVVASFLSSREFKNRGLSSDSLGEIKLISTSEFQMFVYADDVGFGRNFASSGVYEPHVTSVIRKLLQAGSSFLDIGGNAGYYSLLASRLVGPQGRVFTFEPLPANVKLLVASLGKNEMQNVSVFPCAAVTTPGVVALDNSASNGNISELKRDIQFLASTKVVCGARIDDFLGGQMVNVVKIDVEGAEYLALKGAEGTLRASRPAIVSELSPAALPCISGVTAEAYLNFLLLDREYELWIIQRSGAVQSCGRDVQRVLKEFQLDRTDHIDVLACPSSTWRSINT
jgi:FkbM family methyltransferase